MINRSLTVPIVPNRPLLSNKEKTIKGKILLRFNTKIQFAENYLFEEKKIKYDTFYQNDQSKSHVFNKHMQLMYKILKSNFIKGSKLVEVGCGKGEFLSIVKRDKYFQYAGYDLTYEGKDNRIFNRYLKDNERIKADVVILRHVLEHIYNPYQFLEKLKKIFTKTKIFIEVPNYNWILKNNAFYDITYEHVNYFSPKSLGLMFSNKYYKKGLCFNHQYQYILSNLNYLSKIFKKNYNNKNYWKFLDFYKIFPTVKFQINKFHKLSLNYKNVYIWGAATKGCMFLMHCLYEKKLLNKVKNAVDINISKCNKYLPISKIKIITKNKFFKIVDKKSDLLIVSNPNYLIEIKKELEKKNIKNLKIVNL